MSEWSSKVETARRKTIREAMEQLTTELQAIVNQNMKTCLNCEYFEHRSQLCTLANAIPPPKVAALGCEMHLEEIPF